MLIVSAASFMFGPKYWWGPAVLTLLLVSIDVSAGSNYRLSVNSGYSLPADFINKFVGTDLVAYASFFLGIWFRARWPKPDLK